MQGRGQPLTGIKRLRDGEYVFQDRKGYTQYHSSYATASQAMRQSDATYRKKIKSVAPQRPAPPTIQVVQYANRTPGGNVMSERKYFDGGKANTTIQNTSTNWSNAGCMQDIATTNCLFAPQQGNDISNREGRNVYVYNIRVTGEIRLTPVDGLTTGQIEPTVRLLLVMDKQTNATQMAAADLLLMGGAGNHTFDSQNTANFGRFQILKDQMFNLQPISCGGGGTAASFSTMGQTHAFKITHKFSTPLKVNFNGTNAGTVADIVDNSFHFIAGASNATAVTLNYQVRTSFVG